jgi:osmotically-inducible protein OsmY
MDTATITAARADRTIQEAVKAEFVWTPDLDASNVAVPVEDSAVNDLTVNSLAQNKQASLAAWVSPGVTFSDGHIPRNVSAR